MYICIYIFWYVQKCILYVLELAFAFPGLKSAEKEKKEKIK